MKIKLHDKYFKPFISAKEIDQALNKMVTQIAEDLGDIIPIFIGVLNGSFMVVSDFVKKYPKPCEVSFVKIASYDGVESSEDIKHLIGLNEDVSGRTVVIIEDIIDTGNTLESIYDIFGNKGVNDLRIATLFHKPEAFKKDLKIDYVGLEIPNKFIVGYGLDYNGLGRDLPEIYQIKNTQQMTNIVLFGKPGAGKGTQAEFLKTKYNLVHISTGDVFRFNMKNDTELGKLAKSFINEGQLVPDSVTIDMLQAEVEKNTDANGFIFDGFPRTTAQAEALDAFLESKEMELSGTVALEANDEVLIERLLERGKISGRADDQDETKIRNRFEEYNEKTAPLINFYTSQDKFYSVNGIGSIEDITLRLSTVIDGLNS
ncbi:adenylate kinase [Flavobacteriaceae bacterium]|jgi:adenylate kinase|nr:adenylate kinase [Flavobacteriaceae bacterium]